MRRSAFVLILILQLLWASSAPLFAQSLTPSPTNTAVTEEQIKLEKKISEYEKNLSDKRAESNTLAGQLQYLDKEAYVTQLKIEESEAKIIRVKKEAELLAGRIVNLDQKLDLQLKNYIVAARERYKQRTISLIDYILNAENATGLIHTLKYRKVTEDRAQQLVIQTEETKQNFENEKQKREKIEEELLRLQKQLQQEQIELANQQQSKRLLIAATKNQESEYQAKIAEARAQILSLKNFRQSTGTNTIAAGALGTGEGGWYLSQRDERWAGARMGNSSETVLDVGCFISSLAMVLTYYGHPTTPLYFSSNPKYFLPFSAWAYTPSNFNGGWPAGLTYREIPNSEIDGYLNRNIPVITSVRGQSHYVVLKKKVDGEYIMNDPIYGPDLKLSQYYSLSGRAAVFE